MGITIECQTPDEAIVARVDPDQVRQVLWNLIKNAIQASPQFGSVCVSIYASSNEEVVMEVGDEGDGIRPADRNQVFESYHSSRTHGVGLGLALVRQIVDGHRGRIEVDSPPGRGATFRVSFPRIHSEPPMKAVNA
jgi:signal transduction histidine kinase